MAEPLKIRNTYDGREAFAIRTEGVGIEEKHGERKGTATHADGNVITENSFSGHNRADVILAGEATRCEDNGKVKVMKNIPLTAGEKRRE